MAYCTTFINTTECIIEYNTLMTIKLLIFAILFLYSVIALYYYREFDIDSDNFTIFKILLMRIFSYMYLFFLPLFGVFMLRPTIDFENFLFFIISFYLISIILFMAGGLLFGWEKIKNLVSKPNRMRLQKKIKYGKKDN